MRTDLNFDEIGKVLDFSMAVDDWLRGSPGNASPFLRGLSISLGEIVDWLCNPYFYDASDLEMTHYTARLCDNLREVVPSRELPEPLRKPFKAARPVLLKISW